MSDQRKYQPISFGDWCSEENEKVNGHHLHVLTALDENLEAGLDNVATAIPGHYAAPERIARLFERLGKVKVADFLREKLPKAPKPRSADLGEILATEYIDECTEFSAPIKRLRWKDHREMAMRGDDVIGILVSEGKGKIQFLKCEVKSRKTLAQDVVTEAREALDGDKELPSPHALEFLADRLHEDGQTRLSDSIDVALLKEGISHAQVTHLLFIFCGNKPDRFLKIDLNNYQGRIGQKSVGLSVDNHQEFIAAVFDAVGAENDD